MSRHALLLGATGLVGSFLLARLLHSDEWQQVTVLGRREPTLPATLNADLYKNKLRFITADLTAMADFAAEFSVDDVFCCLGTTLRQAGSKEAFAQVDLDFCVAAAKQAKIAGAKRFLMVSAVNANAKGLSFYARIKGQAEQQVIAEQLPATFFMQPSLLQGKREEFRLAEELGVKGIGLVMPLLRWSQASWLPVEADVVADAMAAAALFGPTSGVHRLRYAELQSYAQQLR
jgi:uncharacterized protein YbjT (DUF2867 family)